MDSHRPYFLWDYDLSEDDVRRILREGSQTDKLWLTGRILTSAHFNDVWKYLTIKDILAIFPKLRMRSDIKNNWLNAFRAWNYYV